LYKKLNMIAGCFALYTCVELKQQYFFHS